MIPVIYDSDQRGAGVLSRPALKYSHERPRLGGGEEYPD